MPIEVDYQFPPGVDAGKQGKVIAVGQTAGTWDARYAEQEAALRAHLGEVVETRVLDNGHSVATVRFPDTNVEGDLGTLLTMIFGKYSMAGAAKVVGLRLPAGYGTAAKFGITGIRDRVGVHGRPLIMAIFKPSLGLTAEEHAAILEQVADARLDVIKDDEIMADLPAAPTLQRLRACRRVLERVERQTGRTLLYAVNVTGRSDMLHQRARMLVSEGANALLVNGLTHGWSVVEMLAADPAINVPLFLHPSLAGALCGAPHHGFGYGVLLGTLAAHSGADAVLYPARYGSLPFDANDEQTIREELRARAIFPVPSAGIQPGIIPKVLGDYGTQVILNAGTGIMDHPDGPGAGVQAFFAGLDHYAAGAPFTLDAIPPGPLRRAVEKWGT